MSRTTLITGGIHSGKSRWAISYFAQCDEVIYISVGCDPDQDVIKRTTFSNSKYGVQWLSINHCGDPAESINSEHKFYIYDSIPRYVQFQLDKLEHTGKLTDDTISKIKDKVISDLTSMIMKIGQVDGNLIIITLESGSVFEHISPKKKAYVDILCAVNQRIANMVDEVYLSVCGIQLKIK